MSTANSTDDEAKKPPPSAGSSGTGKKNKSKGFIESSDFKPSWLETGPLPADVLPALPDPSESASLSDEYAALQETLQRLYGDAATTAEDDVTTAADVAPAPPVEAIAPDETRAADAAPAAAPAEDVAPRATKPQPEEDESIAAFLEALAEDAPPLDNVPPIENWRPSERGPTIELAAPPAEPVAAILPAALLSPEPVPPQAEAPVDWPEEAVATEEEEDIVEATLTAAEEEVTGDAIEEVEASETAVAEAAVAEAVVAEAAVAEAVAEEVMTPAPVAARRKQRAQPKTRPERLARRSLRRPSRLSAALLILSLLLLAAAAVIYFINPFVRLALATASLARPVSSPGLPAPGAAEDGWCVRGNFANGDDLHRLRDDGAEGDVLADDDVFSLEYPVAQPGSYRWQVVDCADPTRTYPATMAWIVTDQPNQPVTFIFDSAERADRLFFPIPYAVSALDSADEYHIIGSFQDWIVDDASGRLEPLGGGLYQHVRRIARSGSYQSYVIAGDGEQAIDAYGRTTEPIPFAWDTDHSADYVIFLIDIDRGRASVMYDMPPLMTRLAFGGGNVRLSLALTALAGLLLLALLLREMMLRNPRLRMETGCPRCHEQELMRISRRPKERLLHLLAIPAYRYRCRNCTWEGTLLSESGRTVSPGAAIAHVEGGR